MDSFGKNTALDEMLKTQKVPDPPRAFSEKEVLNFGKLLSRAWYFREIGEPERVDVVRVEAKFYVGRGKQFASVSVRGRESLFSDNTLGRNGFRIVEKYHEDWLPELQLTEADHREYVAEYGDHYDDEVPDVPSRVSRLLREVIHARDLSNRWRLDYECFQMPWYEFLTSPADEARKREWRCFIFVLRPLVFHAPHYDIPDEDRG